MRYLTLAFVAIFATSCTGENDSMRGYFYDMAEPPMMLMDGDGASGGGGSDDDDRGRRGFANTGQALTGGSDPGAHGENLGGPGRGNEREGFGTTGGGEDRGFARGGPGGGGGFGNPGFANEAERAVGRDSSVRGGPSNQLSPQQRPARARAPAEAEPDGDRAEREREAVRRAVVTLGIPGTLARANTLF